MKHWSRRKFLSVSAASAAGMIFSSKSEKAMGRLSDLSPSSLKGRKILFIYGGWEGHEPRESVDVFVPWMESEGAEVVVPITWTAIPTRNLWIPST